MAYVAVNKSGHEYIYSSKPYKVENYTSWRGGGFYINIPKGSIAKLIGRELTWNDEPVELIETNQQDKGI